MAPPVTHVRPLASPLLEEVNAFLDVPRQEPSRAYLDALMAAYTARVPWESAFRIARRAATARTADCPRWPDIFWRDAIYRGGGGTCFESNYAFFTLLTGLGFRGYLTINDMGQMCGCHTACVIRQGGHRYLVDVGIPLYRPIPLAADRVTRRDSPFHTYTVTPRGGSAYEVSRDRHPNPYIFTLIDRPVSDADYRAATTADYDPGGHFLGEVIISKVIDAAVWRYNGRADPPLLESFGATPTRQVLGGDAAGLLAAHFAMDATVMQAAFDALSS